MVIPLVFECAEDSLRSIRHLLLLGGLSEYESSEHVCLCLSQDLETGCPKLAIVKFWGVLFFN